MDGLDWILSIDHVNVTYHNTTLLINKVRYLVQYHAGWNWNMCCIGNFHYRWLAWFSESNNPLQYAQLCAHTGRPAFVWLGNLRAHRHASFCLLSCCDINVTLSLVTCTCNTCICSYTAEIWQKKSQEKRKVWGHDLWKASSATIPPNTKNSVQS